MNCSSLPCMPHTSCLRQIFAIPLLRSVARVTCLVILDWPFSRSCAVELVESTNTDMECRLCRGYNRALVTARQLSSDHQCRVVATTAPLLLATLLMRNQDARSSNTVCTCNYVHVEMRTSRNMRIIMYK